MVERIVNGRVTCCGKLLAGRGGWIPVRGRGARGGPLLSRRLRLVSMGEGGPRFRVLTAGVAASVLAGPLGRGTLPGLIGLATLAGACTWGLT